MASYTNLLNDYASKYDVDTHTRIFMTNHVHILAASNKEGSISRMKQLLGRYHVCYYNKIYRQSSAL